GNPRQQPARAGAAAPGKGRTLDVRARPWRAEPAALAGRAGGLAGADRPGCAARAASGRPVSGIEETPADAAPTASQADSRVTLPLPSTVNAARNPTMLETLCAFIITSLARLLTGARSLWLGCGPTPNQRIYFANHSSHGDFVLLWASLPPELRARTRPVAGSDYWHTGALRSFLIDRVFNGVLVDRERKDPDSNP